MRPVSIFSATLCGVVWISASALTGVAAQGADAATATSTVATTGTATNSIPYSTSTDFSLECEAVFTPARECQDFCKVNGVTAAASEPLDVPCVKYPVPSGIVTDGTTSPVTTEKVITDRVANTPVTTVTLVNGSPLYEATVTDNLAGGLGGGTPSTRIVTRTRGVTPLAGNEVAAASPTSVSEVDTRPDTAASANAASTGPSSTSTSTARPTITSNKKSNAGAIAGGVVGGILGLSLIAAAIFFLRRRRQNESKPRDAFTSLEKNRGETSPRSMAPQIPITSYDSPPPPPPQQQQQQPESQHSLMGAYSPPGGMATAKQQPGVEVDEDGVSLRSPSPPLGEEVGRGRDYVPRLPIYHRGSDETPRGPAL